MCFDDAHRSFPAEPRLPSQQKMLVELTVQLQQLAGVQEQLQDKVQQQQHRSTGSSSNNMQASGLGSPAKGKKPAWGLFGGKKVEQQQQQQPAGKVSRTYSVVCAC